MGWLSRDGPAGRLAPRRTTCARSRGDVSPRPVASAPALSESPRSPPARRALDRSTLCAVTASVTAAWRMGGRRSRDLRPARARGPSLGRVARCYCAVTVSDSGGDVPQLCGLGSGRDVIVPSDSTSRYALFCQFVNCPWAKQVYTGPRGPVMGIVLGGLRGTTAFVFCAGTLCWPCVAPCPPSGTVDSTARARTRGAPRRPNGTWPSGPLKNEASANPLCVLVCGSSPPDRVSKTLLSSCILVLFG